MNYQRFSERLNFFIYSEGLNPDQLSKILVNDEGKNPSSKSIYNYATGESKPGLGFIQMLARHFPNLNMQWLINGLGGMYLSQTLKHGDLIQFDQSKLLNKIGKLESILLDLEKRVNQLESK